MFTHVLGMGRMIMSEFGIQTQMCLNRYEQILRYATDSTDWGAAMGQLETTKRHLDSGNITHTARQLEGLDRLWI